MDKTDLAKLIAETQQNQKKDFAVFENYMNQSVDLKKSTSAIQSDSSAMTFLKEIIDNVAKGIPSNLPIPQGDDETKIYAFLLENSSYIEKLGGVSIPSAGNADERLQEILQYIKNHESPG